MLEWPLLDHTGGLPSGAVASLEANQICFSADTFAGRGIARGSEKCSTPGAGAVDSPLLFILAAAVLIVTPSPDLICALVRGVSGMILVLLGLRYLLSPRD